MTIYWWHWIAIGLVLILLELAASGGFYVIFFGVAAITIGSMHLLAIAGPLWMQLLLFSVLSVGSLILFRSPLVRWLQLDKGAADVDSLVGETAFALEDLPPGAVGRAELRGTVWSARNDSTTLITRGQRCSVVRVERLTICILPEGAAR